ncbi:MAG: hypothetical protein QM766_00265 [Burkholderiaceae bacterium]
MIASDGPFPPIKRASGLWRFGNLIKRNKPAAVVLSEDQYHRLIAGQSPIQPGMTAVQWLLSQPVAGTRSKADIDKTLTDERAW